MIYLRKTFKRAFPLMSRLQKNAVFGTNLKMSTTSEMRVEKDSLGEVKVPANMYWGAQTQRSIEFFDICRKEEEMPIEIINAVAIVKSCAAIVNHRFGILDFKKKDAIVQAASEITTGKLDDQFPLSAFQTGSGTQTNMNVNEVIANKASELLGGQVGQGRLVHPNDDVNMSQSSNDTIPTAMHIAVAQLLSRDLIPALEEMTQALKLKSAGFSHIIKIGRTHGMDATPLTLKQEFSAYVMMLIKAKSRVANTFPNLYQLPQGGTAVGTGVNSPTNFGQSICKEIQKVTGLPFVFTNNRFEGISAHDAMAEVSGALNTIACSLTKIANDLKLLASGPRCGLGELSLPANEPGSSIMPGKVNPTQCEALAMACAQVMGNAVAVTVGCAGGVLQLNVYKPLIAMNVIRSAKLLAAAVRSMTRHCVEGIRANEAVIEGHLRRSLMLATALNPEIGYSKASECALKAHREGLTLKEATLQLKYMTEKEFDEVVDPKNMIGPYPIYDKDGKVVGSP